MTTLDRDGAALLAAIQANPDEDTPRLAFADWLDAQPTRWVECPKCEGARKTPKCQKCKGKKRINVYKGGVWGRHMMACRECESTGGEQPCPTCSGRGEVEDRGDADRAEFIRVECELARSDHSIHAATYWASQLGSVPEWANRVSFLKSRESELRDRNPQWASVPCPKRQGNGACLLVCDLCGGSGDLLKAQTSINREWSLRGIVPRPHTFRRGFLYSVYATLAEWGQEVDGWERVEQPAPAPPLNTRHTIWQPTPFARAVAAVPGVGQLRVTDREPEGRFYNLVAWYRHTQPWTPRPKMELPGAVFDSLKGGSLEDGGQSRVYTPEAAHYALARALWKSAREAIALSGGSV